MMCHANIARIALRERNAKLCPKCREHGIKNEMELVIIDPSYLHEESWETYVCNKCGYERCND